MDRLNDGETAARAPLWRRLALALPDAVTCALFVLTWLEPFRFGPAAVKTGLIVMLLEFLVVHSSGFFAVLVYDPEASRAKRTLSVLGLSLFYLLFVLAWALSFGEWWPLGAFAWLIGSRLGSIWIDPVPLENERTRQIVFWALSVVLYLGGVLATVDTPLPHFGIPPEIVPALGITGGGLWLEQPHRVIAFGALYFGGLAAVKLFVPALAGGRTAGFFGSARRLK